MRNEHFEGPSLFSSVLTFSVSYRVITQTYWTSPRNQKTSLKLRLTLLKERPSDIYNKASRNQNFPYSGWCLRITGKVPAKNILRSKFNVSPWHKHILRSNCLTYPHDISPYPHRQAQAHGSPRMRQPYLPLSVVTQSHETHSHMHKHRVSTPCCHKVKPGQICNVQPTLCI